MRYKLKMDDVEVDVIIDRRRVYGLADSLPFCARIASTSSYLGSGRSYWDVSGDFTAPEKRIIARAIWKAMEAEVGSISFRKQWVTKDIWGYKCRKDVQIDLPGRKP